MRRSTRAVFRALAEGGASRTKSATAEALAKLPVTRKSDLVDAAKSRSRLSPAWPVAPVASGWLHLRRPARSTTRKGDQRRFLAHWRARCSRRAFGAGELVHNTFSYHFTPAGMMMDLGAQAVGCAVFPAGTGQTELQVAAIADLRPDGYAGTPSFLRIILEKGRRAEGATPVEPEESAGVGARPCRRPVRAVARRRAASTAVNAMAPRTSG